MYLIEKFCYLVLLYYYMSVCADGLQLRFDYKYFPEVNGSIKFHQMPVTWHDARLRCHYEDAVLASPTDTKFLKIMKDVIASNRVQSCGVFTGIHSIFHKGVYSSIEGVPLSRIPVTWAPNEPDNFENSEDCLILLANGTMADVKCTETFPYMCFKENKDLLMTNCGTLDPGYSLDPKTGSCYKIHTTAEVWPKAYMICAAEGGHLAIINSEEEAQVIAKLFSKYPTATIKAPFRDSLLVGIHDWGQHGSWYTVHGQTLEQAGYTKWEKNQPDNITFNGVAVGEFCGAIYRSTGIDDFWCSCKAVFICEKSPTSLVHDILKL